MAGANWERYNPLSTDHPLVTGGGTETIHYPSRHSSRMDLGVSPIRGFRVVLEDEQASISDALLNGL